MPTLDEIRAEPDAKIRAGLRAAAVRDAWLAAPVATRTRSDLRVVFDSPPGLVRDKQGDTIGVEVMVRAFRGLTEIKVDPHRVIINPPIVPRTNLTYAVGALDVAGRFVGTGQFVAAKTVTKGVAYRRIVGAADPVAALIEAVADSVEQVPNAPGWRTRGTVTTTFATAPVGEGTARSVSDVAYSTARTGGTLSVTNNHTVGQNLVGGVSYNCYESSLAYDTSGVPDTDIVSAVVASLDGNANGSTTDFIAGLAASAYNGGAVVTGDWVSGASIPTPELATWNSSGYSADYNAFTETASFAAAINKTGSTFLILYSQRHRDATTPTGAEQVTFTDADAAGTTTDPKLDITHAAAGGTVVMDIISSGIIAFAR